MICHGRLESGLIIGKMRRALSLLLAVVWVFCCLVSCSEKDDWLEQLKGLENEKEVAAVSAYRVVIPSECSAELVSKAEALATAILRKTKIETYVVFDSATELEETETIYEVLVGLTCRETSKRFLSELDRDDYVCFVREGCLILGGVSEGACVAAIDAFCNRYLPFSNSDILMKETDEILYDAEYKWKNAEINGISLRRYCLIYPSDAPNRERELTHALRDEIADRCGVYLKIFSDKESEKAGDALWIEIGTREDASADGKNACLVTTDRGIALCATDSYGLLELIRAFSQNLFRTETQGQMASMTLDSLLKVGYDRPSVSILNIASAWVEDRAAVKDFIAFVDLISMSNADLILLGPMGEETWKMIKALLPSFLSYELFQLKDEMLLPVLTKTASMSKVKDFQLHLENGYGVRTASLLFLADGEWLRVVYLLEEGGADAETLMECLRERSDGEEYTVWVLNGQGGCRDLVSNMEPQEQAMICREASLQGANRMLAVLTDEALSLKETATENLLWSHAALLYQLVEVAPFFAS